MSAEFFNSTGIKTAFSAGNFAYVQIPSNNLRGFFDNLFPALAKNTTADCVRGFGHRFMGGHDLFIDVPKTFLKKGSGEAFKQTGHILLTDWPTKAGIPIPGLSASGIGKFLTETCHIPNGYLCLNVTDTAVGIFAMTEGTFDLFNVISGQLRMSPQLFLDTFIEGTVDIIGGVYCENPLLLIAGAEQIAAGVASTFYTITHPLWFVSPIDFFTGVLSGGIATLIISKFFLKKDNVSSLKDAAKSCAISGLFAISTGFGIAGIAALLACGVGKLMADRDNKDRKAWFKIGNDELIMLQVNSRALLGESYNTCWFFDEVENRDEYKRFLDQYDKKSYVDLLPEKELQNIYIDAMHRIENGT